MASPSSNDPKQGEREYYARIGAEGIAHAIAKPYSDDSCPLMLADLTAIFHLLARRGYDVTGVDISPEAIALAREQSVLQNITRTHFVLADYEEFRVEKPVDYVLFYSALHHAEDEQAAMRCAYESLADGGLMIAFEPGRGHGATEDARRAVEQFAVHEKEMPPEYIVKLGRSAGFRRHLILPSPHEAMRRLYRTRYGQARSQFDLRSLFWLSRLKFLRTLFRPRSTPFVVMWK
ncbi:MAG: class I SAM-dependent methyltransferase [Opitutaceae bacterium]|nr:class I SAM-dependent methyltransferase [Opitutaceae bacterium]